MTPTNVAEVQSKRALRRSSSVASLNGSNNGRRHHQLQRTPSVGSMMERTFRSPSPGRSPAPRERDVPPVPAMPSMDNLIADQRTNGRTKTPRGSSALQTQPFKTASEKIRDSQNQQGSWFGAATARETASPRAADAVLRSPVTSPIRRSSASYDQRPGSAASSINFSYPRSNMRSPSPTFDDQTLVYDANSRRMVVKSEMMPRSQSVRESPPVEKPRKKQQTSLDRSGSHLSKGTVARTQAPALEAEEQVEEQAKVPEPEPAPVAETSTLTPAPATQSPKKKKKKGKKKKKAAVPALGVQQTALDGEVGEAADARPALVSRPSVVEEDPEGEDAEGDVAGPVRAVPMGSTIAIPPPAETETVTGTTSKKSPALDKKQKQAVGQDRVPSESPARSARFSAAPDQLAVKHEPPPRSVSPRKSALKLRGVSPSDDGSEPSARAASPFLGEDATATTARKKSARVSWDDRNTVVVGEAAAPQLTDSPVIPSPQTKKPWHSVVSKFTRKDPVALAEDETMTPRPALPQFGSVREKKVRDTEERPLVRPADQSRRDVAIVPESGHSTDESVGAILAQDAASRNAPNTSRYREPLSAVPSIEKDEDNDAEGETSEDFDTDATTEPEESSTPVSRDSQPIPSAFFSPATPTKAEKALTKDEEQVPSISVSTASPRPEDPQEESDEELGSSGASTPTRSADPLAVVASPMADIREEDEETETDRFSDAQEDLEESEAEGNGFLSLDAVVDSPPATPKAKKPPAEMIAALKKESEQMDAPETEPSSEPPASIVPGNDWENAKAYWKSLTVEKRRQLEIEALSETGEEVEAAPVAKQTPKKEAQKTEFNKTLVDGTGKTNGDRTYQIQPGSKWSAGEGNNENVTDTAKRASLVASQPKASAPTVSKMRQSMRQSTRNETTAPATHDLDAEKPGSMRKSMRAEPAGPAMARPRTADGPAKRPVSESFTTASPPAITMRKSLRSRSKEEETGRQRPNLSSTGRPVSYHAPSPATASKEHRRNLSSTDLSSSSGMKPTLRRRGSDESDSSFKRRKRAGSGDGHSFRMSMRASTEEPPLPSEAAKRFSLRSLSPPAFRRNSFSSLPAGTSASFAGGSGRMRQSLRDRPTSSSSRMRMGGFKKQPAGFGRKAKNSRFGDSSDEDDDGDLSFFKSRFADSSDEDEPAPLPTKGRGMAKSLRGANGSSASAPDRDRGLASPEPESDGEGITQPKRRSFLGGNKAARDGPGRGTLDATPTASPARPASRRGSFMSILRRKKDPSSMVTKDAGESVARKDTPLERSNGELAVIRNGTLHKRKTSWPLPDEEGVVATDTETAPTIPAAVEKDRPSTAGGESTSRKSAFLRRRSASQGGVTVEPSAAEEIPPVPELPPQLPPQLKKKKFGALRKMFGIHD